MCKRLTILIFASFISAVVIASGFGVGRARKTTLLQDGFILAGVDGRLTKRFPIDDFQLTIENRKSARWFFKFDSELSDGKSRIGAGATIELLPSAALEKVTADVKKHSDADHRLWGRVTKYKGRNFIFGIYSLPLSKINRPQSPVSQKPQQQDSGPTINEPNDALTIPQEIIDRLKTRRIVRPEQLLKGLELKTDCILADRTGFIRDLGHGVSFVPDALGRNIQQQISFQLLPCQALERAQRQQSVEPEPLRFKVAGIVTQYKDEHYLLLQQAVRVYSHENFGR